MDRESFTRRMTNPSNDDRISLMHSISSDFNDFSVIWKRLKRALRWYQNHLNLIPSSTGEWLPDISMYGPHEPLIIIVFKMMFAPFEIQIRYILIHFRASKVFGRHSVGADLIDNHSNSIFTYIRMKGIVPRVMSVAANSMYTKRPLFENWKSDPIVFFSYTNIFLR